MLGRFVRMDDVTAIREACAQLRRLPEPQWSQPPRLPLGARAPHVPVPTDGRSVEAIARDAVALLMDTDAQLRGVQAFPVGANKLALPDVIEALTKSLAASSAASASAALAHVAQELQRYG